MATVEFSKFAGMLRASTLTASSFRIWNSSSGIPSPPLALFVVMFAKAHLTSHSRKSSSKRVITPQCLTGSLRSFLYSTVVLNLLFPNSNIPGKFESDSDACSLNCVFRFLVCLVVFAESQTSCTE